MPAPDVMICETGIDEGQSFTQDTAEFTGSFCVPMHQRRIDQVGVPLRRDILRKGGVCIEGTDLHSRTHPEFKSNGGIYPDHNVYEETYGPLSPQLNLSILALWKELGITPKVVVPNYLLTPEQGMSLSGVAKTFSVPEDQVVRFGHADIRNFRIEPGDVVISCKKTFNACMLDPGLSDTTAFHIFMQQYSQKKRIYAVTGVVDSICVIASIIGIYTMEYEAMTTGRAKIILISDGTTPLALGTNPFTGNQLSPKSEANAVITALAAGFWCEAMTAAEFGKAYLQ